MEFGYYEQLCGASRVNIRLATLMYIRELLKEQQYDEALRLLDTACAADERRRLREVREEVWQRLKKARAAGDHEGIRSMEQLLRQIEETKKLFSV